MANPPKPWKAEYAKSSRSSCKSCRKPIDKECLRFGKMVEATQFDGFMPMWHHSSCILRKANRIRLIGDVEGFELLRWEDQQNIRKYIDGEFQLKSSTPGAVECGVEVSKTSRATCRCCKKKIAEGEIRISTKPEGQVSRVFSWHHAKCYMEISSTSQVEKFSGWDNVSASARDTLLSLIKKNPSESNVTIAENKVEKNLLQQSALGSGVKRKRTRSNQKSKIAKSGWNAHFESTSRNLEGGQSKASVMKTQLELQTKALWDLKDDLKRHVATSELREMLEANDQNSRGSVLDLRERCADGMLFGALAKCPLCSGSLRYSSGMYRCSGYLSEWSKCSYSTTEPQRLKGKWKIPEETSNEHLLEWFKSQTEEKIERVFLPTSPFDPSGSQADKGLCLPSKVENFEDLRVSVSQVPKESTEELKNNIENSDVQVHAKIKKETNCLLVMDVLDDNTAKIKKARAESIAYTHRAIVKVKGQSAVHGWSGLEHSGHILDDGKSIYNTTLNKSDLLTGVNSYYILQVIEHDKRSDCYVFRKWGRVGDEMIGGSKLENMSKSAAIKEFKRLFLEKSGNSWETWEQKENFNKKPGRFYPIDVDYGVTEVSMKKQINFTRSQLAPQLVELMMTLFNVDIYRATMMEFEINLSEMPLGKLSKYNIEKGFEALTQIQNLLNSTAHAPSIRKSLLVDASNKFFTVIPSVYPKVIKDEDDFKSKVKMLEALQDIEIASRVVGFGDGKDDSIDEKYKKLCCNISPLPHDSEDFQLIKKYLHTTHAPTHTEWALELEEVFSLEREGELDKYAPYQAKLKNKMLLWHGSRLTNFVGILSQGLRIAPPAAPKTGYMFGKGIYFADMVSKSAQYCYTSPENPVGLMLLSEVALGEVYELKKSKYMDKPPEGKNSTKGLGQKVPRISEHATWRDDVIVPCGKPVSSRVKATDLMYNEYIVYDSAQVKLQFLLKVRFRRKRRRGQ